MKNGIHVIADENGVVREYREVKRRAKAGEKIKIVNTQDDRWKNGDVFIAANDASAGGLFIDHPKGRIGGLAGVLNSEYVVLEPTDIVHHDGKRYREVDRKAREGEMVHIYRDVMFHGIKVGTITAVTRNVRGAEVNGRYLEEEDGSDRCYYVLEPITDVAETSQTFDDHIKTLQTRLETLEKRVAALETKVGAQQNNSETTRKALGEALLEALKDSAKAIDAEIKQMAQKTRDEIVERAKRDVEELERIGKDINSRLEGSQRFYSQFYRAKYVVNREKRTVVALLQRGFINDNDIIGKGIARCAPDDVFNIHIGKAIALRRALGLRVPDEYVNAPQSTEPRVGDVVVGLRYQNEGLIGTVAEVRPTGFADWDKGMIVDGFTGNGWCYIHNTKIIDDSRDGYVYKK